MLRLSKLAGADEIDNGLAYYRYTFLAELPRLYAGLDARHRADIRRRRCARCRRSCAWARGSAATATAIRSSSPPRSTTRSARRPASRFDTTSTRCIGWAASCRCRRVSCARRPSCWRSPRRRTTKIRIAATSRTGRRWSASTRGSRRPRGTLAGYVPPRAPHADRPAVRDAAENSCADLDIDRGVARHAWRQHRSPSAA